MDRALLNQREVTMPAGTLAAVIRMRAIEFRRLTAMEVLDFAMHSSQVGRRLLSRAKPRRRHALERTKR